MMHPPHNPLTAVASEAMEMGDKHGSQAFRSVAVISMGVVAAATAAQVFIELMKALNHRHHERQAYEDHSRFWRDRIDEERRPYHREGRGV